MDHHLLCFKQLYGKVSYCPKVLKITLMKKSQIILSEKKEGELKWETKNKNKDLEEYQLKP